VPRAPWVLIIAGAFGFYVGMIGFPDWQVAVETSQVVAGLVEYPAGNPFYIYHTKVWTILHQLVAPLLREGVSEIQLSLFLSGVLGMVAFQALAMFVYAFSGDALLAVGATGLIFLSRAAEHGAVYPVYLVGNENTYGMVGTSFCVLTVAMIGAGWYRTGALLLGLAPAVHPTLGAWLVLVVVCAIAWDPRQLTPELRRAWPWFAAGCTLTAASLAIQLGFIHRPPPATATPLSRQEISAFVTHWDSHRKPIDIAHNGVTLNFAAFATAIVWLVAFARDLPKPSLFLLRVTAVSALMSIALVFVSWVPPDRLPTTLLVMMPGRVLNFNALTFVALIIGLLGSYNSWWSYALLTFLGAGLLAADFSLFWVWLRDAVEIDYASPIPILTVVFITCLALVAAAGAARWRGGMTGSPGRKAVPLLRALSFLPLAVAMAIALTFARPRATIFRDRTNDVFLQQVAAGRGVLLTAGDLHLVQLKTRRPVLLDGGGLDGVLYALDGGGEMRRILREVYGIDLVNPPADSRGEGRIPPAMNQRVWESYSIEDWRRIRRTFHVMQVLTYADWLLNLPVAAQSRRLLLYEIPSE
jgi:hypothetical protein